MTDPTTIAAALDHAIGALGLLRAALAGEAPAPCRHVDAPLQPGTTLAVEEVARRLGRHPDTIREDLRAGRLPGVKIGRSWRVVAADLDAHLKRTTKAKRQDKARVAEAKAWMAAERAKRTGG